jgi:hypothetical protein
VHVSPLIQIIRSTGRLPGISAARQQVRPAKFGATSTPAVRPGGSPVGQGDVGEETPTLVVDVLATWARIRKDAGWPLLGEQEADGRIAHRRSLFHSSCGTSPDW